MDERAQACGPALPREAAALGLPLSSSGEGSVMGVYVTDTLQRHEGNTFNAGEATQLLHLAALTTGSSWAPAARSPCRARPPASAR